MKNHIFFFSKTKESHLKNLMSKRLKKFGKNIKSNWKINLHIVTIARYRL